MEFAAVGSPASAFVFGGTAAIPTDLWSGSSWSTTTAMSIIRDGVAGAGTPTAALAIGGHTGAYAPIAPTEKWNGAVWSTTSSLNMPRYNASATGDVNGALAFGGWSSNVSAITEKWTGNTWYTSSSLNITKNYAGGGGTYLNSISFGGQDINNNYLTNTELWKSFDVLVPPSGSSGSSGPAGTSGTSGSGTSGSSGSSGTSGAPGAAGSSGTSGSGTSGTSGTLVSPMTTEVDLGENAGFVLDAALSATGKYSGISEAGTAGATLAFGDLCYLQTSDSRWELVDANVTAGYANKLGICILAAAADGSATKMLLWGKVRSSAFPTLTIGAPVYISETAGDVVVAQPTTADACIRIVGFGNTADELFFCPSPDYVTHV
jgi:hypothetical protein